MSTGMDEPTRVHTLRTPDNRQLVGLEAGAEAGIPVVYAHGMPGSALEVLFFHEQARIAGLRVLALDRPGIRGSSYQQDRILLDYPRDLALFLDHLGIERCVHMGWSSGGSRTLAAAHELPGRIRLAVLLSSYTHFREMAGARRLLLRTLWPGPLIADISQALFRATVALITAIAQRRPDFYMARARSLFSDADHAILADPGQVRRFRASQLACLNSGARAIATDLLTEMGDWGFRLGDIRTPTLIHQGAEDQLLPPAYARHLAATLPDAELTMLPHSGHFYPLSRPFQGDLFQRIQEALSAPPVHR
ncbi:alpha/beta fold hydrolase [Vreelandella utahensis]|uniref:alpha/beta fold hydrolase n=1 Tax=Vreelandella halophila TaxID=86177 RepID=UPI0009874D60|nr:alpha/beta hydrolase [Halomonas utahensis]